MTDLMYVDDPREPEDVLESHVVPLTEDYGELKEVVRKMVRKIRVVSKV